MSETLGRYTGVVRDNMALDLPYAMWPGVDLASVFVRSNIPPYAAGSNIAAISTGTCLAVPVYLRKGETVTKIKFVSGGTAGATLTHWWFALYDTGDDLLQQTADQTSTAWAADTEQQLSLAEAVDVTIDGWYSAVISVTASTVPTLRGADVGAGVAASGLTGAIDLARTFGSAVGADAPSSISSATASSKAALAILT